jgi:hypothetical protein
MNPLCDDRSRLRGPSRVEDEGASVKRVDSYPPRYAIRATVGTVSGNPGIGPESVRSDQFFVEIPRDAKARIATPRASHRRRPQPVDLALGTIVSDHAGENRYWQASARSHYQEVPAEGPSNLIDNDLTKCEERGDRHEDPIPTTPEAIDC